jgi:alpha-amylase/alpha-mannosidase (GH57 family)
MHQPYYKDPETGTYILPWVRLHAIKDYVALPRIFRDFPGVRHTFNLVPSLLVQAKDYVENGAEDIFLTVSRKSALDLTRDEEEFLLRNFFSAFAPTMILPQPRYAELFQGHEAALRAVGRSGVAGGYGASEYTDLVTLFNLTWFHPMHREEDPGLSRLWRKGSGFTEREKQYVLDRQIGVMAEMFEEYRRLVTTDGGELSSSPMYHPILPLLIDNRAALDAWPGASLPRLPFAFPHDAETQLAKGREVFRELFGFFPRGLWPSEGSISPAALELAARAGYEWTATDELLLAKAFGKTIARDSDGVPVEPMWFYRPYAANTPAGAIPVFFRDHRLSDLIGFEYSRWDAHDAANNFIHNIKMIYNKLSTDKSSFRQKDPIIPVILDGENAWEYFHDSGEFFLRLLMDKLQQLAPNIECVTFSSALEHFGSLKELPTVPTGSWIDGTFHIWIGHSEDHAAWDMLSRARSLWQRRADLVRVQGKEMTPDLRKAEEFLHVAEGSDWCWWYGDDHFTPHGPEFDRLFRHNVKAAYTALGIDPPDSLDIPIIRTERLPTGRNFIPSPRSYIHPKVDGLVTSYFEWSSATKHVPNPEFGAMHRAGHILLSCFYYGFNEREIYFRFDLDPVATENSSSIDLEIVFPLKNRLIHLSLDLKNPSLKTRFREIGESSDETGGSQGISGERILSSFQKVLEISIPFESLSCNSDDRLDFFLTIQPQGHTGERWPLYGTFSAELPGADYIERMWEA